MIQKSWSLMEKFSKQRSQICYRVIPITGVVENPIGELQELCQRQQITMPVYEFEEMAEGFRCTVKAMGLQGVGQGRSKKEAKVGAAEGIMDVMGEIGNNFDLE